MIPGYQIRRSSGTHLQLQWRNVKSKDSSQIWGEHQSWLTGSGSHGLTGAKESTTRMKTTAAQVVEQSSRPLYSSI